VIDEISQYYGQFDFAKFYDAEEDSDKLRVYAGIRLKGAFANINTLASNGTDVADALRQISSDMSNFAAVLVRLEKKLGHSYSITIDEARRRGGLIGKHYCLDANKAAVDLVHFITGSSDPFDIPQQSSADIHRRLECVAVAAVTPKKQKPKTVYHLSAAKKKEFLDIYNAWIDVDTRKHRPRVFPKRGDDLTVQSAMAILNIVLSTMYDSSYGREGYGRRTAAGRSHNYVLTLSDRFVRRPLALQSEEFTTPFIDHWQCVRLKDLGCGELVELDQVLGIVQPAAPYFWRLGVTNTYRRMRPVKLSDLGEIVAAAPPVDMTRGHLMQQDEEKAKRKRKARDDMAEAKSQKKMTVTRLSQAAADGSSCSLPLFGAARDS
jgi:hypothetical protein